MKRLTAFFLSLGLSLQMLPLSLAEEDVNENNFTPIVAEDFEENEIGNYSGKTLTRADYYGYHYNQVVYDEAFESKAFKLINLGWNSAGEWTSSTSIFLSGISYEGNMAFEERIKTSGTLKNMVFRISDGQNKLIETVSLKDGYITAFRGDEEVRLITYEPNIPVNIRIVVYTDNNKDTEDTYDIYVDGTLMGEKFKMKSNLDGVITRIQLAELGFNTAMVETVVDDFKVYKATDEIIKHFVESQPVYPEENALEKISTESVIIDKETQKIWAYNEFVEGYGKVLNDKYVSLGLISDIYHAPIEWDEYNKTISFDYKQRMFTLKPNSCDVYENNICTTISHPIKTINGVTSVPVSFLKYIGKTVIEKDDRFLIISDLTEDELTSVDDELLIELFSDNKEKVEFYVSKDGNNENDGSFEKPFADLVRAQQAVREKLAEGFKGDIDVIIRGGKYFIEKPMVFDYQDSPAGKYRVTYKSYDGEKVALSKAKEVTGWTLFKDGIYKAKTPEKTSVGMVIENGELSQIARYPNDEYLNMIKVPEAIKTQFKFNKGDFPVVKDPSSLEVNLWPGGPDGYWAWFNYNAPLQRIDFVTNTAYFVGAQWSYDLGTGTRYFMQNALEFIDMPGEYYIDKNAGEIYYKPKKLPIEEQTISIPVDGNMFVFKGKNEKTVAKNIIFEGVEFTETARNADAVKMNNARNIQIKDCIIHNIGASAVDISGFSQNNKITGNKMYDIGHSGVNISNSSSEIVTCKGNVVHNNYIYNLGRVIGHGAGVNVSATGNVISNNRIHTSKRYAISLKGTQKNSVIGKTINGVKVTAENASDFRFTDDNIIEFNDVSDCNIESQDSGVIECYGIDGGNLFRNNAIHDSDFNFSLGVGFYFDDGNDYNWLYNNLMYDLQQRGRGELETVICLKGVENKAFNNILVNNNATEGVLQTNRMGEPNNDVTIESNIFYDSGDHVYLFPNWTDDRMKICDYNLFYNPKCIYNMAGKSAPAKTLEEWQKSYGGKFDANSVVADPGFINADENDFRIKYDSTAYMTGFKDINVENIGLTEEYKFVENKPIERLYVRAENQRANSSFINMSVGGKTKLHLTGRTEKEGYVLNLSDAQLYYTSDNSSVATVDSNGIVEAKGKGVARIKIKVSLNGNIAETCIDILVDDSTVSFEPKLQKTTAIEKDVFSFKAFAKTAYNHSYEVPMSNVNIISSDEKTISVQDNKSILALKPGKAEIKIESMGKEISHSFDISKSPIKSVALEHEGKILTIGDTAEIKLTGIKQNGDAADLEGEIIEYKIDNEEMATLESDKNNAKVTMKKEGIVKLESVLKEGENVQSTYTYICAKPTQTELKDGWKIHNGMEADGYASFKDNMIEFCTSGLNVWGASDDYTILYKDTPQENSEITVKIDSIMDIGTFDTAFGPMYRTTIDDTSYFMTIRVLAGGATRVVYRNAKSPNCGYKIGPQMTFPAELKLVREGDNISAYAKTEELGWQLIDTQEIGMGENSVVGVGGMAATQKAATIAQISELNFLSK